MRRRDQALHDSTSRIPVAASYFPAGQSVQTVSPVVAAYFPVGQTVHALTPLSRLLYVPTGHALAEILTVGDVVQDPGFVIVTVATIGASAVLQVFP